MGFWNFKSKSTKKNSKTQNRIKITTDLEWNEIEFFINQFAKNKPNLNDGKKIILQFVKDKFPEFNNDFINDIDFHKIQSDFIQWVRIPLIKTPPKLNINSFYFGLFKSSDPQISENNKEVTVIYITGSSVSPADDEDWAVDAEYSPSSKYCVLSSYLKIDNELNNYNHTSDIEQILFNGITNLILVNSMDTLKKLINKDKINVGSGFDSGDCFMIE
jgi:hypothetical protein